MSEGTIVTFYSYKGGVGRTFALANIGALLSLWGYKTLCVDWDLEAPGLHLYFKSWLNKSNQHGLTELVQSHVDGEKPDWQKYVSRVNIPYAKASLYLMSAGLQDKTYIQRMQALNWTELYESHTLGNFLEELRGNWKETLDFVLIDSRTGISDIGSICTVQLPDLLVLLLTANDQSLYGSLDVLQSIEQVHANLPLDRAKLWIMPVVSRFEGRVEYTLAQEWLAIFAKALAPIYAEWAHKDVSASDLLNFTRIPYVPYWSFGEKLPVIEKGTEDPEDIGFLLETLASLVARKFSHSDVLIKNRDSFVALAKRGPIEAGVLISSNPSDQPFALRLKRDLEARGFTTRSTGNEQQFDLASQEDTLGQIIRTSQLIVLIVSPHTWPANLVEEYWRIANMYKRRLVFVWAAGDDRATVLPDDWGTIPALDLIDARQTRYESALDEIINRIEKGESIISPLELTPSTGEPRNPYKGLRAFTESDAADFFGREGLIEELLDELSHILTLERPDMTTARMLSVIGPSGSGKSSLIMAGLLPQLQRGALPGSKTWLYLNPMVPGKHPIEALGLTLATYFPDRSFMSIREDLQDDATRGLHVLAAQLVKRRDSRVVLLVDQFEELFTQTEDEDERRRFIELLLTAVTEPRGPLIVLLTLRADFYNRPMGYPQLYQLIQAHQTNVLPMAIDVLRRVIEMPAALPDVRLTFEGNLVGDLLSEVQGQVGALPLLQFTLDQLFHQRNGHRLTLSAYRELGGVKGALTRQAEETYAALPSEEHRKLARALFVRLIDPGATEQDTTRRRAALSEFTLAEATQTRLMRETIDAFIAARLLTTNEIAETTTIEVGNAALIREWARLNDWLREAREDISIQQAISQDAEEWRRRGKPTDRVYRGTQLIEALAWAERNLPSGYEMEFLQAGSVQGRTSRQLYFVIGSLIVIVVLLLILLLLFLSGKVPKFV